MSVPGIPVDVCLLLADVCVPCVYKMIYVLGDKELISVLGKIS
jgi:hypothetical protein